MMPVPESKPISDATAKMELGGIGYTPSSFHQNQAFLRAWLENDRRTSLLVSYVNPHVFNLARKNRSVRELLSVADLVAVDGIGMVLGLLLTKGQRVTRTVMTPLFDSIIASEAIPRLTAILIGGSKTEASQASMAINRASPRIRVTVAYHGYYSMEEYVQILRRHSDASLILVGMGTPRAEEFLLAAKDICPGKLCWNIGGGTVHYYAGTKRRVPKAISALGMQWIYRMVREPTTIRRYAIGIPVFFWHLLKISCFERHSKGGRT